MDSKYTIRIRIKIIENGMSMTKKYDALIKNKMWELVPLLPNIKVLRLIGFFDI